MAVREQRETYFNSIIDCADMTLTEYSTDEVRTYSLKEILNRWDGVSGIVLEIRHSVCLPTTEG